MNLKQTKREKGACFLLIAQLSLSLFIYHLPLLVVSPKTKKEEEKIKKVEGLGSLKKRIRTPCFFSL
jgi:hypothetical protein